MIENIDGYLRERYESWTEAISYALDRRSQGRSLPADRLFVGFTSLGEHLVPIPYLSSEVTMTRQYGDNVIHSDLVDYHTDVTNKLKSLSPQPLWRMAVYGIGAVIEQYETGDFSYVFFVQDGFKGAVREYERKSGANRATESVRNSLNSLAVRCAVPCSVMIDENR